MAYTQWLAARGQIGRSNPPIAELDGVSANDGLTSQTYYDNKIGDSIGLDNSTGRVIQKLGGGTYNLSLSAIIAKAASCEQDLR